MVTNTATDPISTSGIKRGTFKRVVIAVDESESSLAAIDVGRQLARDMSADVALIHVIGTSIEFSPELEVTAEMLLREARPAGDELMERAHRRLGSGEACTRVIRAGNPPLEIVNFAHERRADLIIVGMHGRGRLARLLLGS